MSIIHGAKWGDPTLGTPGGTVTWSIAGGNEFLFDFGIFGSRSKDPDSFLRFDYEQIIEESLAEWAKYGNIQFQQVPDGGGSAGSEADGDIRIFFGDLPGRTLGLGAFPNPSDLFGGDILLDARGSFNQSKGLFRTLVLHEIGHALGLDHVSGQSIMTPVLNLRSLQRIDRDAMRQIYGDPLIAPALEISGGGIFQMKEKNNDLIARGNDKKNIILGTNGQDTIEGGGNNDKLKGSFGSDSLSGGEGNDKLIGSYGNDTLRGEAGDDVLRGDQHADVLDGGDGFDTADYSKASSAVRLDLLAGTGTLGDADGDTFISIEEVLGTKYHDRLWGDGAANRLYGDKGSDELIGGAGDDTLLGGGGDDTLLGGDGHDTISGDGGNDLINGEDGNDTIKGSRGDDTLAGGLGDDEIKGSSGKDVLFGDEGNDTLSGGMGADRFVFADGGGDDVVRDFNRKSAAEVIDLSSLSTLNDWADVQGAATDTDDGLLIDIGGGDSILIEGLRLGQLGADDFLF